MDSDSRAAVYGGGGRSGGKFMKRRPIAAGKTPYDRPTPTLQRENPSWVNALVFPAKFVAGGASKLLSSIWNPKSWASRSSSSSENDSDSEDDCEHDGNLHDGGGELNQNKSSSSGKSEILCLVEQLLMLEHFSREECDRLIEIVNLRVDGSKYLTSPNRDYLSGGSWSIHDDIQRLHSKATELMKPKEPFFLQAPEPGDEAVNMESKDTRTTRNDLLIEVLPSLPTIEEKGFKDDKTGYNVIHIEDDCDMVTEYAEVDDVIYASQGSSNTKYPTTPNETDSPNVKPAATRTKKYATRRRRGRGK